MHLNSLVHASPERKTKLMIDPSADSGSIRLPDKDDVDRGQPAVAASLFDKLTHLYSVWSNVRKSRCGGDTRATRDVTSFARCSIYFCFRQWWRAAPRNGCGPALLIMQTLVVAGLVSISDCDRARAWHREST